MSIDAPLAVAVKIVEGDELLGQGVMVGRHFASEDREARVAIALRQVPQNLVVGSILFDDVNDVLDRGSRADFAWNYRRSFRRTRFRQQRIVVRSILTSLFRVCRQLLAQIAHWNDFDAPLLQALHRAITFRARRQRAPGTADIGVRTLTLAVSNIERAPRVG